jgi:hypothetical protein
MKLPYNGHMSKQTTVGQLVTLDAFGGPIERVVVEILGDVVAVCRREELERAKRERRNPVTVGFRRRDIIMS